jgi:hypothetical protein
MEIIYPSNAQRASKGRFEFREQGELSSERSMVIVFKGMADQRSYFLREEERSFLLKMI